jgi:hypothetical protein
MDSPDLDTQSIQISFRAEALTKSLKYSASKGNSSPKEDFSKLFIDVLCYFLSQACVWEMCAQ